MSKTQINLMARVRGGALPPKFNKPMKSSLFVLVFAFIIIAFEIAFLATFYRNLDTRQELLQKNLSNLNKENSDLQREIGKLKAQAQEIKPQPNIALMGEKLKRDGKDLIKILETVSQNLPTQAWISTLSQKDNHVVVNGFALDNEAISSFLSKLEKSKNFESVKLIVAEQMTDRKGLLKKFTISCAVPGEQL